jgi:hypothetical protein
MALARRVGISPGVARVKGGDMSENKCTVMEMNCLERARLDPLNRGKWIAQAERWHELASAQSSWRLPKPQPLIVELK